MLLGVLIEGRGNKRAVDLLLPNAMHAPATLTTCTLAPESSKRSRSSSVPGAVGTPVREAVAYP
jgi:hypothetical protein